MDYYPFKRRNYPWKIFILVFSSSFLFSTLNNFLGMSKYGASYRADAENYGWIFWIAILEQDAVCASRLNNLGNMVLFK